jgi:hypothetical protein
MSQTIKAYDTLFSELITSVRGTTMEKIQQKQYILEKLETLWRGVQQDMKLLEELKAVQTVVRIDARTAVDYPDSLTF